MNQTLRNSFLILLFTLFFSNFTNAQMTGKFIKASIGFGSSTSNYVEEDPEIIDGFGFYAQGEYVIGLTRWFSVRPYAGVILTSSDEDIQKNPQGYKVETKAFLLGGKVRLCAPIPWIAPFIESGIGTSIGSFETYTQDVDVKKNGPQFHIPVSVGLALGRKNNIEIAISFYLHPSAEQSSGVFAAGFSFPLE